MPHYDKGCLTADEAAILYDQVDQNELLSAVKILHTILRRYEAYYARQCRDVSTEVDDIMQDSSMFH